MATTPTLGPAAAQASRQPSTAPLHAGDDASARAPGSAAAEFDRQVQAFVGAGYPALAGLGEEAFRDLLEPLRAPALAAAGGARGDTTSRRSVPSRHSDADGPATEVADAAADGPATQRIPFAVVVTSALVTPDLALPRVHWRRTTGWTEFTAQELATFAPAAGVRVPDDPAYLVTDVDTGAATLGVTVRDALPRIAGEGRTPLTIDEGVSLLVLFPGILEARNAFFLPGSRCGDKRVTALWVSKGHPRLGWCWEGNPHTWLGSASAAARISRDGPAAG